MLVLGGGVGVCAIAGGGRAAKRPPKKEAKAAKAPEVSQRSNAVIEAQRSLAADISQLRDQLNAVQRGRGGRARRGAPEP